MPTRREILRSLLAVSVAGPGAPASSSPGLVRLTLDRSKAPVPLPRNFLGFGYEESSAARPGLLSADNTTYVQLVRNLGPEGVLRLGGIVADYTRFSPAGPPRWEPRDTVVSRASFHRLRGFLDATGWQAIWSLNFGRGTLPEAVEEAKAVQGILGPRLLAVELGNEVENYGKGAEPRRTPPYGYEAYRTEWAAWRAALLKAVPELPCAAPDTAGDIDWVERMAADARGKVRLLTTHYYRGDQRKGTEEQLLTPDRDLQAALDRLRKASAASGIPWRMCEANSFYGGGRPGVSDTLAGALWTLDFLLLLAANGCAGVNLETGVNHLGFVSSYSPVVNGNQGDSAATTHVGNPYYAMLAFRDATENAGEVLPLMPSGIHGLTAYALGDRGRARSIVLVNKGREPVRISLEGLGLKQPRVQRLGAPSPESTNDVHFGGMRLDASGKVFDGVPERTESELTLAAASAAVLQGGDGGAGRDRTGA